MSLDVIDFTQRKKTYKLEAGEFNLKPPYMYLVQRFNDLTAEVRELDEKLKKSKTKEDIKKINNKLIDLQIDAIKLILDDTEKGKVKDITPDNCRLDVIVEVTRDFLQQWQR